jgi:hypothetical protein
MKLVKRTIIEIIEGDKILYSKQDITETNIKEDCITMVEDSNTESIKCFNCDCFYQKPYSSLPNPIPALEESNGYYSGDAIGVSNLNAYVVSSIDFFLPEEKVIEDYFPNEYPWLGIIATSNFDKTAFASKHLFYHLTSVSLSKQMFYKKSESYFVYINTYGYEIDIYENGILSDWTKIDVSKDDKENVLYCKTFNTSRLPNIKVFLK